MRSIPQILINARKLFCILLLCIMGWQQWTTFLRYQEKFLSPIQFTKKNIGNDGITLGEERFEEIKKMFPKPIHLTYFGEENEDAAMGSGFFSLAQYYLAPNLIFTSKFYLDPNLILKSDISNDTLLYNLYTTKHINPATNFHLNNGWHIIKDFDNGLILLSK